MAEVILSCRYNNSANEVESFFLKPYLDIQFKRLYKTFSRNFEKIVKTYTGL